MRFRQSYFEVFSSRHIQFMAHIAIGGVTPVHILHALAIPKQSTEAYKHFELMWLLLDIQGNFIDLHLTIIAVQY